MTHPSKNFRSRCRKTSAASCFRSWIRENSGTALCAPEVSRRLLHPRHGVTLIELLVVISIIGIMSAMMIPRLRMVNQDRNIREAARVVGSVFASASNRARLENGAGVLLERQANLVDAGGINYASTTMYVMRSQPPYVGDGFELDGSNVKATVTGYSATIPAPLEHTPANPLIRANDRIRFNHTSALYPIVNINPAGTVLTLGNGTGYLPPPPQGDVPFVIYRQPKKLESSRVELPDGYIVNLRCSGPPTVAATKTVFDQTTTQSIVVTFDQTGAIDWLYPVYDSVNPALVGQRLGGPLHWFVMPYDPDPTAILDPSDIVNGPFSQASNLWVTVNQNTGGVHVGYSVPPPPAAAAGTLAEKILAARTIVQTGQSAAQ